MKHYFRVIIGIIFCMVLTACMNTNNDESPVDTNKQNQTPDLQEETELDSDDEKENDSDKETNHDKSEEEKPSESESPDTGKESEIVIQNDAFQIFEPTPNTEVKNHIVVRGLARVFEATFMYEFEDGHFIIDEGFITANGGPPGWGEFEFTINLDNATEGPYRIVIYEESAKDGSIINELIIPVQVSK